MTPDQKAFQRSLALQHVERFRAAETAHPMSEQRIAAAVAGSVGATADQVLKWMRGAK